jgi:hypothetical protein
MSNQFFKGWARWEFERNGTGRILPYFYYDTTSLTALFLASTSRIGELLPHPDMKPVELVPGRCLVAFAAFEYRKTDVDPYNEVSISFLISFRRRQIPGVTAARMMLSRSISSYVWQLPVTTEHARAGGVDLFGYPKFLADINFVREENWITCTLVEDDQEILSLRGQRLSTRPGKPVRYITYAVEEGNPLMAEVLINPLEYAESYMPGTVELKLGKEHPVGDVLGQIGLSRRAIVYQYSPVNESILFPARNVTS